VTRRPRRVAPLARVAPAALLALAMLAAPQTALADGPPRSPDPWWAPDKALHFTATALIAGGGYGLSALATDDIAARSAVSASLAITAGLAKEALDAAGLGTPSPRDLVWDVVGTIVGVSISLTIDLAAR
jgi:putative lipoprotein